MKLDKISLLKALSYRTLGTGFTFIISFLFTNNAGISLGIAVLHFVLKVAMYYFYDRVWESFRKSKSSNSI